MKEWSKDQEDYEQRQLETIRRRQLEEERTRAKEFLKRTIQEEPEKRLAWD
jgi:hypothetical protein